MIGWIGWKISFNLQGSFPSWNGKISELILTGAGVLTGITTMQNEQNRLSIR
jgi:hypothetical protein